MLYEELQKVVDGIQTKDMTLVMGNLNARIGIEPLERNT